jgi:drug/metabolite transporter (DMT)-like permease
LGAAVFFAGYNIMVRKKPSGISPTVFLFTTFLLGTLTLLPFFIWEKKYTAPVHFTNSVLLSIVYLGLGTSVIAFLLWNKAIAKLGAARTSLFGNLIPLFSSLEAVILLNEQLTTIHLLSGLVIIIGVVIANIKVRK